jgi:hypothetical protein
LLVQLSAVYPYSLLEIAAGFTWQQKMKMKKESEERRKMKFQEERVYLVCMLCLPGTAFHH